MEVIHNVTIKSTGKENRFQITWHNSETNTVNSFNQSADITPEEAQRLWQYSRHQLPIGQKLSRFLDGSSNCLERALDEADRKDQTLHLHLCTCTETDDWPFELLAQKGSFLLPDRLHLVRSVPVQEATKEIPPQNRRLRLLFMACSPLDVQSELDFEQEEEAIFKITEELAIDMEVEDTGSLEGLREKLELQQYDILHLSGHAGINKKGQPFFLMENETGYRENISAEELWHKALMVNPPRLLFISGISMGDAPEGCVGAFAHMMVEKYQVPAVLGWGRWISDGEANEAAKVIYKELSRGKSVLHAVQRARYQLINCFPSTLKPAWPQLRLFSNGGSLNAIVEKEQKRQPQMRRMTHIYLKNSDVKVLDEGFVGRRRQLQQSFRALTQEPGKIGLLILGTGGLGKSCLAGKISERFKEHTLITVHGRLNSITLKRALKNAFIVTQDDHGKKLLSQKKEMKNILADLCRSCFKDKNYLILLDDFEQNLEGSEKGEPDRLLPETAELLRVLLDYLPAVGKITQMMVTCRYGFFLKIGDRDLVKEQLEWVWLTGFREPEQKKKVRELPHISKQEEPTSVDKLLAGGCGNPRLMEWLDVLVGQMKSFEVPELLKAISDKKEQFIRQHVIRELLRKGGDDLDRFLHWFAIYRRPVLKEGAKEVGEKAGLKGWEDLLHRGMDLSLIEHHRDRLSYQATPLLREELLKGFKEHQACHEAASTYYNKKCEARDSVDPLPTEELIYHAFGCGKEDVATSQGRKLVSHLRESAAFLESQRVGEWILAGKKQECYSTAEDALLLNALGLTINDLANHRQAITYYEQALAINRKLYGKMHPEVAVVLNNLGLAWQALGDPRKAIDYYQETLSIDRSVYKEEHPSVAVTLNNLGLAWADLGEYKKAIDYYQQALSIDQALYGEEHPRVATRLTNLGYAYDALDENKKAIDYYQQALIIMKKVYGRNHPNVATILVNLGGGWVVLGDYKKTIDYCLQALSIEQELYGKGHLNSASTLNILGTAYHALGDHKEAINYLDKALSIKQEVYGEKHLEVAEGLANLGMPYFHLGQKDKAKDYFEKAYEIFYKSLGPEHTYTKAVTEWLTACQ